MSSRASKLADLASTDSYAFSSVTTDTLSSSGAKSAFISGNFTITNTESKAGFATYLYTGNNTYPRSFTDVGVDLDTQWGDNPSERYGGLVWIKSRTVVTGNHILCDTIRGTNNTLFTNQTLQAYTDRGVSSFNGDGFSISLANNDYNASTATYASWIFQTTHRVSGTTNHGKAYTSHYNPYTGFTIVRYEGSGVAGHEIPHHLGRKLGLKVMKRIDDIQVWVTTWLNTESQMYLNSNGGETGVSPNYLTTNEVFITNATTENPNIDGASYIVYGWTNSYYDDAGELNGNYEIGVYQGTGSTTATYNKIITRKKPAWVMLKSLDISAEWIIFDNQRGSAQYLYADLANSEATGDTNRTVIFDEDGFHFTSYYNNVNNISSRYLYVVIYDNDSASGKSNYAKSLEASTLQVTNGVVSYSHGVDSTGAVNSIENLGTTTLPNISWDI